MRKILLTALALSTIAATSASAAPARKQLRAAPAITANTVVEAGVVRGTDPDPYVPVRIDP